MDYGSSSPPNKGSSGNPSPSPSSSSAKDTLMPKETCPVCGIQITYKNLARHIKLRHKIKYKFCHRCRKLIPSVEYEDHRNVCNEIVIDGAATTGLASGAGGHEIIDVSPAEEEEEEEDSKDGNDDVIDPTDFLEAGSGIEEDDNGIAEDEDNIVADVEEDDVGPLVMEDDGDEEMEEGGDKKEAFRATTSKNKLESLLGKEFKHPADVVRFAATPFPTPTSSAISATPTPASTAITPTTSTTTPWPSTSAARWWRATR